jgi:hypothetical protein
MSFERRITALGGDLPPLAAARASLGQYRVQAMDNRAKTIQTKPASANAGPKQQTRVSP